MSLSVARRQPEQSVPRRVVGEHLEPFLTEAHERGGGEGLPRFVERELREFLTCGVMARGFARFRCDGCTREILVGVREAADHQPDAGGHWAD